MPQPKATAIEASECSQQILATIVRRQTAPIWLVTRAKIIVKAIEGKSNTTIAKELGLGRVTVSLWRNRWYESTERRIAVEEKGGNERELEAIIIESLRDAYRSGTPPKFSAEQVVQIVAIACEDPQASGYPVSHWTPREVAAEAIKRGVVESISERQVGRFLKRG